MSRENVETLRRAYEAYNRGDIDAAVADTPRTPNMSLSGPSPESATYFPDPRVTSESSPGFGTRSTTPM
jgi:ketosteroid isomerase-like protein